MVSSNPDHGELIQIFLAEASEGLTRLWKALHLRDQSLPEAATVQAQYITAHTLRGSAALYGFTQIAALAERLEAELQDVEQLSKKSWKARVAVLSELVEALSRQIAEVSRTGAEAVSDAAGTPDDQYLLPQIDQEVLS